MFCLCYFLFLMSPLLFANGCTDRNAVCCVKTVNKKITNATNLVNFGLLTTKILWLICMGGDCGKTNIRTVLVKGHLLGGSSIVNL